jgi:hypothetical protein
MHAGLEGVFSRHRGPYLFQVCRERAPTKTKPTDWYVENLPGTVAAEDVESEANALLDDPRDTITAVYVFSEAEQQHVVTIKRRNPAA